MSVAPLQHRNCFVGNSTAGIVARTAFGFAGTRNLCRFLILFAGDVTMSAIRISVPVVASLLLAGCGTYVPEIQEPPFGKNAQRLLVQAIVASVHCEVANAISALYQDARRYPATIGPIARKMSTWGLQMVLTLKTRENSTANPNGVWTPITLASFTLGASATLSSEAIRINILNFYYSVAELRAKGPCTAGIQPDAPVTSLLIQSDLKFKDWLYDQITTAAVGDTQVPVRTDSPLKQNVLSHEVSFVTTGGINPAWKLTEATFNQAGTFLQATRDRTHDLTITMGPGDNAGLVGAARDADLAARIGQSISNHSQSPQLR
jgi:hypothetical protein